MSKDSTDETTVFRDEFVRANSLNVMLDPQTNAYLDELASTRLYGISRAHVAIALIDEGIRNAIEKGFVKVAICPSGPESD